MKDCSQSKTNDNINRVNQGGGVVVSADHGKGAQLEGGVNKDTLGAGFANAEGGRQGGCSNF